MANMENIDDQNEPRNPKGRRGQTVAIVIIVILLVVIAVLLGFLFGGKDRETLTGDSLGNLTDHHPGSDKKPVNLRLPTNVVPRHYALTLQPFFEVGNFSFEGRVNVTVDVIRETSTITLHSHELSVSGVQVFRNRSGDLEELGVRNTWTDLPKQFLIIETNTSLTAGSQIVVIIGFHSHLSTDLRGFYVMKYTDTRNRQG